MLKTILWAYVLLLTATPCSWAQAASSAKSERCSSRELSAAVTAADPIYVESLKLTKQLQQRGYVVQCVLQSKMANFFEGQIGAALYRTGRGDFEALFLTEPHTFSSVRLVEHTDSGRYRYRFEGSPPVSGGGGGGGAGMDCARRTFFARGANQFFVTEDKQLAASLGQVLNPS
jgi:hypothetical protein